MNKQKIQEDLLEALGWALDHWTVGVLVLNRKRKVLAMNHAAKQILKRSDGLLLNRDVFGACSPEKASELGRLLGRPFSGDLPDNVGHVVVKRKAGRPLLVLVTHIPLPQRKLASRIEDCIVFVSDPDANVKPNAHSLRKLFQFTPMEVNVATHLTEGKPIKEICERLEISLNTGRTHLKNLFHKTGTRRQAELVGLMLSASGSWKQ